MENHEEKINKLQSLIELADASLVAGRWKSYDNPADLVDAIIERQSTKDPLHPSGRDDN